MTYGSAFLDLMKRARDANLLAPVDDRGWQFRFAHIWNRFIENKDVPEWVETELGDTLFEIVRTDIRSAASEDLRTQRLAAILEDFKTGTLYSQFSMVSDDSPLSRDRFGVRLVNWKPEFYRTNAPNTPLEDPALEPTPNATITFPSGELIIADWPRIKGFKEIVDQPDISLNYACDRIKRTKTGIKTFNLIEISVGNSCPTIFKTPTGLQFGHQRWDEATDTELDTNLINLGSVTTDYWAVTIIDKVDLIRLLEENGGNAQDAIQAWLDSSWVDDIPTFTVDPGTWKITWIEDAMSGDAEYLEPFISTHGTIDTLIKMDKVD